MRNTPIPTRPQGFTLAETTLSAGIISTALIAVLSLLSSGISSTIDSRIETASSILARRLAAEASAQELPEDGSPVEEDALFDTSLTCLASTASSSGAASLSEWQEKGAPQVGATFFTTIRKEPPTATTPLPRVVVTVEAPASAPAGKRRLYRYVTLAAQ